MHMAWVVRRGLSLYRSVEEIASMQISEDKSWWAKLPCFESPIRNTTQYLCEGYEEVSGIADARLFVFAFV